MDAHRICGPGGPCGRRDVLEKIADARASSLWYSSPFHSASSIGYASRTLALRSEFSSGIFVWIYIILLATEGIVCKVPKDSKPYTGGGAGALLANGGF